MKKLLVISVLFLLVGCNREDEVLIRKCSFTGENELSTSYIFTATNNIIEDINITYILTPNTLSLPSMSVNSLDELDEETKEKIKNDFLTKLGLDKKNKGIEIKVELNENMTFNLKVDLEKTEKDMLKSLGFDFKGKRPTLDLTIADLEEKGYKCKK